MGDAVCFRLAPVVDEALKFHGDEYIFGGKGLSFIHDAFLELFECRSMLQHSYAFSFTRYKSTNTKKYKLTKRHISEKLAFEQSQSVLELMTEQISDVVARSHIRATQTQITFLTAVTSEKRKEFSNLMINILLDEQKEDMREKRKDASGPVHSLSHGLDTIVGLASGIQRSTETMQTQGALSRTVSSDSDHAAESAVRESLQEFLTNTGSASLYEYTSDDDEMADFTEWPCSACTYVNTGGIRCDICQTAK